MKKKAILMLLCAVCALVPAAAARDQDLERQLTSQYHDKVLALRHSFKSGSQEYDVEGTPMVAGQEGPWTVYGRILLKKVVVQDDKLQIEGDRVYYMSDEHEKRLKPFHNHSHVKVTIHLKAPVNSADQAAAVLNLVFAIKPEDIVSSAPAYWRKYLTEQNAAGQDQKKTGSPDGQAVQPPNPEGNIADREPVLRLGEKGVTPPKVVYAPEPEFSDLARTMRYDGTLGMNIVVDKTGTVRDVQLVRPLGMGLDENAVHTVSTWRFEPAKRDGQPAAVAVYIEVSFSLGR